jgi:transcriptional regulator with XRE-family HTH domain
VKRIKLASFGTRLTKLRENAGLSQSGLARRVGSSQSAISQIEAGDRSPSYGMLIQLADGVGVTISFLVGDTEGTRESALIARITTLPRSALRELDSYVSYLSHKHG